MNLYTIIYRFHIKWRHEKKKQTNKQTKTKNVEYHTSGLSKLKVYLIEHTLLS